MMTQLNRTALQRPGASSWRRWLSASLAAAALLLGVFTAPQAEAQTVSLSATSTKLGRLAPDVTQTSLAFTVDAGARTLIVDIASSATNLQTSVELPGGVVVDPGNAAGLGGLYAKVDGTVSSGPLIYPFSSGGTHYVYRLPVNQAGQLIVRVTSPVAPTEDIAVLAQVISDSPLAAQVQFNEPIGVVGRPVVLAAIVLDGRTPATGATVQARIVSTTGVTQPLVLRDDGLGGDGTAGDGLYSALFTPSAPGLYRAAVEISGIASVGPYARQGGALMEVVPTSGTLAGTVRGRGIDLNGNGALDRIAVDADLQAVLSGTYRLFVRLANAGRQITGSGDAVLTPGVRMATALFDTQQLVAQGLGRGPYTVELAELTFVDPTGRVVPADRKVNLGQIDFRNSVFERPPLLLTGVASDAGIDTNANGLFDELRVTLQLDVQSAGNYSFSARLTEGRGTQIVLAAGSASLPAGLSSVMLRFAGRDIGTRGISGPYAVENLLVTDGGTRSLSVAGVVASTQPYSYTQFEGATRNIADLDNDGRVDCADVSIVLASYGKRTGQPGFDPRADVNRDGVVNIVDLSTVNRALPVGLTCQ